MKTLKLPILQIQLLEPSFISLYMRDRSFFGDGSQYIRLAYIAINYLGTYSA